MSGPVVKDVDPLPTEQWPAHLDGIVADMKGAPINVHKLMAHSPHLLEAWWTFRNYSVEGGSLGAPLAELVILRVGVHLCAWYEWGSHVSRALQVGVRKDAIFQTLQADPDVADNERLVLRAVDELMLTRKISDATRAQLEQVYSTENLMDLVAIHGMYVTLGAFIQTWGLELDHKVAEGISAITNEADFIIASAAFCNAIGRSI